MYSVYSAYSVRCPVSIVDEWPGRRPMENYSELLNLYCYYRITLYITVYTVQASTATECSVYSGQFTVYSVKCTVDSSLCAV